MNIDASVPSAIRAKPRKDYKPKIASVSLISGNFTPQLFYFQLKINFL